MVLKITPNRKLHIEGSLESVTEEIVFLGPTNDTEDNTEDNPDDDSDTGDQKRHFNSVCKLCELCPNFFRKINITAPLNDTLSPTPC